MATTKIFEEWERVDCNECARYWDSSCDAVPPNTEKVCSAYKATRSVVLPKQIEQLTDRVHILTAFVIAEALAICIILMTLYGGLLQ
jgi:hypothetical protein